MAREHIVKSERYAQVGEAIREQKFPELQGCRIVWLESDKAKKSGKKIVFAETKKFDKEKLSWTKDHEYDFTITVYQPNVEDWYFDEVKIGILLEHELMHVGWDIGTETRWIIKHDAEEFKEIIRKYGLDWAEKFPAESEAAANAAESEAAADE